MHQNESRREWQRERASWQECTNGFDPHTLPEKKYSRFTAYQNRPHGCRANWKWHIPFKIHSEQVHACSSAPTFQSQAGKITVTYGGGGDNTRMKDAQERWGFAPLFLQMKQWLHLRGEHPGQSWTSDWTWKTWNLNQRLTSSFILTHIVFVSCCFAEEETFIGTNPHSWGWGWRGWVLLCYVEWNKLTCLLWRSLKWSLCSPSHPTQSC